MRTAPVRSRSEAVPMMSLEAALARMLAGVDPLPAEEVTLNGCLGRVLAEPVSSRLTLPPWDNSAMDGFAVRAMDTAGATEGDPRRLRVVGESAAGRAAVVAVEPGTAVRILTGAAMPAGADAVVPIEDTYAPMGDPALPDAVAIHQPVLAGAHVRRQGSDLRSGYALRAAGAVLDPASIALAAAGGHATLAVHRRPRVSILATGDELAPAGASLGPAQIPDSNSVGLFAQAIEAGAEARSLGIAADRLPDVQRRLEEGVATAEVIVVSGGVSVGVHDVVKEAFERVGRMDLWRVAVQPGKPLAFGRANRPDGGEVLLFGLPGNPVSSFVTFELFVRPVLRRLAGHGNLSGREVIRARLTEPVAKSPGRRAFLRVRLQPADRGTDRRATVEWLASLAGGQGSHVLSALALADGLAVVSEDDDRLPAGAEVDVIRLRPQEDR